MHPSTREAELDHGENENNDKEDKCDRRCIAHPEPAKGVLVNVVDKHHRGSSWATSGHHIDDVENLKRADDGNNDDKECGR